MEHILILRKPRLEKKNSSKEFWNQANGKVLNDEFYSHRILKLVFCLYLFTHLFSKKFSDMP